MTTLSCPPAGALQQGHEVIIDLRTQESLLQLVATPLWFYDAVTTCNVWGNRAAAELFGRAGDSFNEAQRAFLVQKNTADEQERWDSLNLQLHQEVEVDGKESCVTVTSSSEMMPGFWPLCEDRLWMKATFRGVKLVLATGEQRNVCLVQVVHESYTDISEQHARLVEVCQNHPMFQFLFDEKGKLLVANKSAMYNMREHLGSCENYNFQMYLSIGECDGSFGPDDMYHEAMRAIFKENKPCHRFPQLRWSKRHPGKYRWVLYEMWPLTDPITHQRAVLVCEQNISQVKALEEQFKRQNQRLEAQLEEALAQRDPVHKPAIDIDTPADKTLKLLDKIMRGHEVSAREAMELRDAILHAGDLRQPVNFNEQLMKNSQTVLDNEVSQSLIQLLRSKRPAKIEEEDPSSISADDMPHLAVKTGPVTQESVRNLIALTKNMPDEVLDVLAKVDDWQFDAFKLNEVSNGRPLSMLSFALFKRCDLVDQWQLHEHKLVKFLMRIEDGYPNNPYHNRVHAADVLQSLHVLVLRGALINSGYCDELSLMSCYLSAIIHDYEHKGVNNDYLIRVSDELAVLYNDRSPMENHHLAASFQLINSDEYNFMPKVGPKLREQIRKQVIDMVLATDMKQHFAIHSMFQAKMQLNGSRPSGGNSGNKSMRVSPHSSASEPVHKVIDDDLKGLVLQVALKCADLGHLASPRIVHKKWVAYLEEEFFRQGDREKANSLTVSPLMDREKNGISKSQVGFFDIVALPLFQSFAQAFLESTPMLDAVKDNYQMWREEAMLFSGQTGGGSGSSSK